MQARKIYSAALLGLMGLLSALFYVGYGRSALQFYGDDLGYYMYLPAATIYHNLDSIDVLPKDRGISEVVMWYSSAMRSGGVTPTGKVLDQYTYGVALMEAPFFFAAHGYEKLRGLPANGYSSSYVSAVKAATGVYALLGLLLIYRILRRYFSKEICLTVVAALLLATNLFWFALHQAGMAHVPLFFLYALLMHTTMRMYERPRWGTAAIIGLVLGLITLIRPTDIIAVLLPLLYGVTGRDTFRARLQFLRRHLPKIALAVVVLVLPIIPQLLYWKWMSGQYIYYSYGQQGFNWDKPKIIEGLFYARNGWLAYTPVMVLSLAGLALYRRYRAWALCMGLLLPAYVYIVYSWYCFNYINGLGSRPMIHLYPLLALPLGACLLWVQKRKKVFWRIAMPVFIAGCILLNMNYSVQQSLGILVSEESNYVYNFSILFRSRLRYRDMVLRDCRVWQPDESALTRKALLGKLDFEASSLPKAEADAATGGHIYHMTDDDNLPSPIVVSYSKKTFGNAAWLKCSGYFNVSDEPDWQKHMMTMSFYHGPDKYYERGCVIDNKIGLAGDSCGHLSEGPKLTHIETHRRGYVYYFIKLPRAVKDGDRLELGIWNMGKREMLIDDLTLELYE